ncbi:MAG: hypothetical protein IPM97_05670 [Bdellovibrionaceae bacterium]|nr:hypothetical protein [Pseudobdellovibrionaceae bacterium]
MQYKLLARGEVLALVKTVHVPLGENFKLIRLPKNVIQILEKEQWTETWL